MSKRIAVNLAVFFGISMLFIVWATRSILSIGALERPYELQADFGNAVGLQPGAEVDYLGVAFGSVKTVERIPGGVRVTMAMDRTKRVPAGSYANIFRKSAIGEQYIDFAPPESYKGPGGPWMRKGERVPLERTSVPLEFSELLRSASRLVQSIPPEDVTTLVHELATGLHGRADSLRSLVDSGDELSRMLVERTAVLDRLATNNTRLTRVVTEHRGSLGQSLRDLSAVSDSLRNARGDTTFLLQRGSALLGETGAIVAHQKGNLDCILKNLELAIDETTTAQRLNGLRILLTEAPATFDNVWKAREVDAGGVWIRLNNVANPHNAAPQFVPPRQLPAVAKVAPCTSPLGPSASSSDRLQLTSAAPRSSSAGGRGPGGTAAASRDYIPASTTRDARPAGLALGAALLAGLVLAARRGRAAAATV